MLLKCLHGHRRFQHCKPFNVSSTFKGRGLIRLCCCSVSKSHPTLCDPTDCSMPGLPILHCLPKFAQTHVHWVNDAIHHLVLCCLLFLLPSIFPSIRVFSNESALHIRWPKYWSFSFSISSSNEYSGLFPLAVTYLISLPTKVHDTRYWDSSSAFLSSTFHSEWAGQGTTNRMFDKEVIMVV